MNIHSETKIAALLKHDQAALEAIVSLSPQFKKLRNPILRKMMAGRTSIGMAAKIGGCSPEDFFRVLAPLGFERVEKNSNALPEQLTDKTFEVFIKNRDTGNMISLDVRDIISLGKDPLDLILAAIKNLESNQLLRIINSFEPVPLMQLLAKQGFLSCTQKLDDDLFHTYFSRQEMNEVASRRPVNPSENEWEKTLAVFEHRLETVDVRALPMPQPMLRILEVLNQLPDDKALLVHHKRIPVFLLPELEERNLLYLVREIDDNNVNMLIFKGR